MATRTAAASACPTAQLGNELATAVEVTNVPRSGSSHNVALG